MLEQINSNNDGIDVSCEERQVDYHRVGVFHDNGSNRVEKEETKDKQGKVTTRGKSPVGSSQVSVLQD